MLIWTYGDFAGGAHLMPINCYIKSDWQEGIIEKFLPGVFIGRLVCANNRF